MRALSVLSETFSSPCGSHSTLHLHGQPLRCGIVKRLRPPFDPADPAQSQNILVRTLAFSVNYRDRSLMLRAARLAPDANWSYAVGSEFCAQVEQVGAEVSGFTAGDLVIGNGAFPDSGVPGLRPGLPTNHGSREWQVLHSAKLMRIPPGMDPVDAAAFPIGGQTAASMVRRTGIVAGQRVLVTAPTSNTSLFVLAMLRSLGAEVDVVGSSDRGGDALAALGVRRRFVVDPGGPALDSLPEVVAESARHGGWHAVVDPFFDVWLPHTLPLLRAGGRYITCGLESQAPEMPPRGPAPDMLTLMMTAMINNLSIIGNCIGETVDLAAALALHAAGRLPVLIDSVFERDPAAFLSRSFEDPGRFGKVVWRWA